MTGRPSAIVGGRLVLTVEGAAMLAAALRAAARSAARDGLVVNADAPPTDFAWLLAHAAAATSSARPAAIVNGSLTLNRRGAQLAAAALRAAASAAHRAGIDYQGRTEYCAYEWMLAQCDVIGAGSEVGNVGQPWRLVVPNSSPVPELLTAAEAGAIIGITPRAVVARIHAGELAARQVGRQWVITEYDARHAAQDGNGHDEVYRQPGHQDRQRRGEHGSDTAVAPSEVASPDQRGRTNGCLGPGEPALDGASGRRGRREVGA